MKIQVKLALYNAISKALIILAIGAFMPVLIQQVIYNHTDKRLLARLDKTFRMVEKGGLDEITLDSDCSFDSYNIFKEEFLSIYPLPSLPEDYGKNKIENSERVIDDERVKHRVLSRAFIYDNQLYNIDIGEGISAIDQLNATIRKFTLWMLIAVVLFSIFLDLGFARLLLRPFNKIINEKLKDVQHPSSFNTLPIKSSTYEFMQLDNSINEMMKKTKETFEIEREFIMNVSHELLTPVSILRNRIENLINDPSIPHEVAEKMVDSQKTLSRLTKIVKALLYISKIENAQFIKNESNSPEMILREVLEELEEWIQSKGITIHSEWKEEFMFYPSNKSLLHTLFFNILTNAIKYNVENGHIDITGSRTNEHFSVSIKDTGIGISSSEIPFIFDRFRRFRPSEEMSYGLGLPIVKTIAEFHQIKIVVESEINKGSTFILLFPLANN